MFFFYIQAFAEISVGNINGQGCQPVDRRNDPFL